ncbi:MAG: response regulator [Rubrivivax sp.]|nr:response regulator [Rubrivivax sp.]
MRDTTRDPFAAEPSRAAGTDAGAAGAGRPADGLHERQLAVFLRHPPALWTHDLTRDRVYLNASAETLLGLRCGSDGLETRALTDCVHPEDRSVLQAALEGAARSATEVTCLLRIRGSAPDTADGRLLHARLAAERDGGEASALVHVMASDVSEARQLAQRNGPQRAARERLIAAAVEVGLWEHDVATGVTVWDRQMWRLRGLEPQPDAVAGIAQRHLIHPQDLPVVDDAMRDIHNPLPLEYEFRVRWPDGSWRWLASRSITECDANGAPVRRVGLNWSVDAVRQARQAQEAQRAALLELQARTHFLSRMSHELRTPLNAVLGFAQLLQAEETQDDAATRQQRVAQILTAGRHLLSLIDDVLDLARLEGGEAALQLTSVPLQPVVEAVVQQLASAAAQRQVQLLAGRLDGAALADPSRLKQVLINLSHHALDRSRAGGTVIFQAQRGAGLCILRVRHGGDATDAPLPARGFEPFQEAVSGGPADADAGVGLAIVKALVERMGGTIQMITAEGREACLELRLRDGEAAQALAGPLASPELLALAATGSVLGTQTARVLYVEDNPVNAMILAELAAQRPGLELRTADTGSEGLRCAREWQPALVLLDMQLPDLSGQQVFEALRADPLTAGIPCIALSANALPGDIERARQAGFADYWTKPLDFKLFHAAIDALFGSAPR